MQLETYVRWASAFTVAFAPAWAWAQASAPITSVTLYPGSATVVRTVRVEAGSTRVVIPELTTQFATESLRVDADPGIRIGQIVTQDTSRTESANAAQATIEAKIQALKDQSAALDVQAGAADIVKGYLERTGSGQDDRSRSLADAKALTAVVAAISQAANDALGKKQQVALQQRDIGKKIAALERDLARASTQSHESRAVTIQLAAERAGVLRVSYQVNSAGWRPAYRAELDSATSKVAIERLAQVSQKTGEDWKGVKLTLSTAQPRQFTVPVSPEPWLLTYHPPRTLEQARARVAAAPAAAPAAAAVEAQAALDNYAPPTFQTDSTFATEFAVPNTVTLSADGQEISLALARESWPARQRVQVAPRQSTIPVIMGEVDRPAGVWPGGNLQLHRDGHYVGAMRWTPQADEKWELAFGRDELLQVRVEPIKGDSGSSGVFEKRNVRDIADRITLHSSHKAPIDVLVIAPTPVSTAEEIKVKASFEPQPTIQMWKQKRGVVAWERTLAPQQTSTIDVAYTIEYPKEGSVGGLR